MGLDSLEMNVYIREQRGDIVHVCINEITTHRLRRGRHGCGDVGGCG